MESAIRYIEQHATGVQVESINMQIQTSDDVKNLLKGIGKLEAAAICIDSPPGTSFDISATALWDAGIPFIHGGLMTESGFYGPLFSASHNTPHPAHFRIGDSNQASLLSACFAPYNTMIGAYMAAELIHHLAGAHHLVDYSTRTFVDWHGHRQVKIEALRLHHDLDEQC